MWLAKFPTMTKETFMNFDDYKKHIFKPKSTPKTSAEIMSEMMPVIKAHEKNDAK